MDRVSKILNMLNESPEDCFLNHALGLEYLKIGKIEDAVVSFNKVLNTDINYVGTYYHLAKAYETLHEPNKAVEIYEKGIEIAKILKDNHARNELQMALEELID